MTKLALLPTILLLTYNPVVDKQDTINKKIEKFYKKELTYYWPGNYCPSFTNTKDYYGFKIECIGCLVTGQINRYNRRVVRRINKMYGKNWFQNNKSKFY